ncbi:bifunctional adenosylcobinamide kinase/adenosylcobinamide-phosphate guanylyltransferase [Micromonospora fiedleri]|uniref:Adenosylcobinamide kinase n=1 Tax=Micromonospora fiedleri TaxID=1157498 RepID=A0ABS1UKD9_9ACTN|nr:MULTISPECIES: bifunctional adenosylcobinamide kinase/adenosylcobinamide-phosphate guanylyltransferase [Micromonospora]MBL6275796.1 bifunctional adenosylcobinamide kinase/adenosylcobinamide-phosphate guanylyltransferase [Micromonospora fiedleri]WSK41906.1 bifunctional adenosylcobinamide kinase/adenosylcobinamide-phosphate guanylyltransferase [Micromonospora maris]
MSLDGWNRVLVLGGIRSGKSEFAESLVADAATVRYVATAAGDDDAEWAARLAAHRARRPAGWSTEETASDPRRLADVISAARPDETLLVDDLGGWVTVLLDPAHQPADDTVTIDELITAVRGCAARLVLVSPEVGLSLVPTTPLGRAFTDALGVVNRAVAGVCDVVLLVVAGQPCQLKPATAPALSTATEVTEVTAAGAAVPATGATVPTQAGPVVAAVPTPVSPPVTTPLPPAGSAYAAPTPTIVDPVAAGGPAVEPGLELPMPDEYAGPQAVERLATLDVPGRGFGVLEQVVSFAAGTQGTSTPQPWRSVRVLLLHGDHQGGAAAGTRPGESGRRADQARAGQGVLARLAAESAAGLQVIEAPTAAPIEHEPALTAEQIESALSYGWQLAEEAADAGVQLLVLAACGAGTEAAAAAVLAATAGAEAPAVLARVINESGEFDDASWMIRCAAIRDALHRTRGIARDAKEVLAQLGGGDIAVATGVLLGATARRTPVLLDGPVGVAAALVSRDLAGQARHWCLLADDGGQPAVRLAADVLGLTPLAQLKLDLGEGANALTVLPLLRSALTLAAALPSRPDRTAGAGPDDNGPSDIGLDDGSLDDGGSPQADEAPESDVESEPDFREPEPEGPGPTSTQPAPADHSGSRAG